MTYKIDPDVLARECRQVLDLPLDSGERFSALIERLSHAYPEIIENRQRRWLGSRAGGILGKLTFLHISFSEYLLIFGCPAGTQGFSGRYNYMELYKVILAGRYTTYNLESDQIGATVYTPGDLTYMKKGEARGLEIDSGSWHLEYGRGPNITAMPFGLMDTLVSSVDVKPLAATTSEYMSFLSRGLRNRRRSAGQST
ncbi:hypothetical protein AWC29_11735 [Mycobacterium triplex]|uniref:ERG2 and Sigma1 receptor like protein n=1 Tax=Mycobacterium triplex TaxID=47839 RepID=A0A024K009_9MYCO|nr:hypothetical protein [Mycobacterium triplex]ORX05120.1 hypothetical protein AWC29_11735 [Mycobacterium triplex]CDO89144.1 ERG2 and Sigma1 receptor like protein [Mycobacterium triplex]